MRNTKTQSPTKQNGRNCSFEVVQVVRFVRPNCKKFYVVPIRNTVAFCRMPFESAIERRRRRRYEHEYRNEHPELFRKRSKRYYDSNKDAVCLRKALHRFEQGKNVWASTMIKLIDAQLIDKSVTCNRLATSSDDVHALVGPLCPSKIAGWFCCQRACSPNAFRLK
jgi:hypothetical protein